MSSFSKTLSFMICRWCEYTETRMTKNWSDYLDGFGVDIFRNISCRNCLKRHDEEYLTKEEENKILFMEQKCICYRDDCTYCNKKNVYRGHTGFFVQFRYYTYRSVEHQKVKNY